jgi:hypothetical protein
VKLTRVVVESEGRAFRLDLHDRFTVVAGLEPAARRSLASALVTAMGAGRPGLHLEASTDDGRHLAIFRPPSRPPMVIDVDDATDVTASFAGADGRPDLLGACGVAPGAAVDRLVIGPRTLENASEAERRLSVLARLDQARVWEVANKVAEREEQLGRIGADPHEIDPDLLHRIDERHRDVEAAQAQHERSQRVSLLLGANAVVLAGIVGILVGWPAAVPLLVAGAAMIGWSIRLWRMVDAARRAETAALDEAGADSYLAFQLSRLDRALDSEGHRQQVAHAASAHRAAIAEWGLLAGDIPVSWYLEHRNEVETAALRLRSGPDRRHQLGDAVDDDQAAERLARLSEHLSEPVGPDGPSESLPVICDDPLVELHTEAKPPLMEALVAASSRRQVILLTGDPEVAEWARVEALTGEVGLVEAAPVR